MIPILNIIISLLCKSQGTWCYESVIADYTVHGGSYITIFDWFD